MVTSLKYPKMVYVYIYIHDTVGYRTHIYTPQKDDVLELRTT